MDLARIAYQWAWDALTSHCTEQNIDYDGDVIAYQLMEFLAGSIERDFRKYLEQGAQQLPDCLFPGLAEFLAKQDITLPVEEPTNDAQELRVRTLVETWCGRALGTYGICYNFDTAYYDGIESASK